MKMLMWIVLGFSILTAIAPAQAIPVADIAAGYSVIEVGKGYSVTANGGSVAFAWNFNPWLGAVVDFGAYHASFGGVNLTTENYMFGPRVSYRYLNRLTPFGQILLGGNHASASASGFTGATDAFAVSAGGGADVGLDQKGRFALRPQIEYLGLRANQSMTNAVRISIGLAFRFGRTASR